jgi:hypothetical protein
MRGAEKIVLLTAVAIPIVVATLGWPMFVNWIVGPPPAPATPPAERVATATPAPVTSAAQPTARSTSAAQPTARSTAAARPTVQPTAAVASSAPEIEPTAATAGAVRQVQPPGAAAGAAAATPPASDPGAAVSSFYALVSSHQFDSAAQLWSPRMRAAFPPDTNLIERFSQTQNIRLQRADVVSQDQSTATVAVDLVESNRSAGERHFVGNWYLVRGANGWVLDQPQLYPAP